MALPSRSEWYVANEDSDDLSGCGGRRPSAARTGWLGTGRAFLLIAAVTLVDFPLHALGREILSPRKDVPEGVIEGALSNTRTNRPRAL